MRTEGNIEAVTVDTSVNSTTVHTGRAKLMGVYVNTALSAHTVIIKDDTTAKYTIPASATAGQYYPFRGPTFMTSLVVDPDDLSTGNITVEYIPVT